MFLNSEANKNSTEAYRGTSLMRNSGPLGPYHMTMPRALRCPPGGRGFLLTEIPL